MPHLAPLLWFSTPLIIAATIYILLTFLYYINPQTFPIHHN